MNNVCLLVHRDVQYQSGYLTHSINWLMIKIQFPHITVAVDPGCEQQQLGSMVAQCQALRGATHASQTSHSKVTLKSDAKLPTIRQYNLPHKSIAGIEGVIQSLLDSVGSNHKPMQHTHFAHSNSKSLG